MKDYVSGISFENVVRAKMKAFKKTRKQILEKVEIHGMIKFPQKWDYNTKGDAP